MLFFHVATDRRAKVTDRTFKSTDSRVEMIDKTILIKGKSNILVVVIEW